MERNKAIDALRGIAAVCVMLMHYTLRYEQLYGHTQVFKKSILSYGGVFVWFFFFISTFFLFIDKKEFTLKLFLEKKIKRIYIPYCIAVVIIFIASCFYPLEGRAVSVKAFLLNFLLFPNVITGAYVDSAHWYVLYLFILYVYVAIIKLLKIDTNNKIKYIVVFWIIIALFFHLNNSINVYKYLEQLVLGPYVFSVVLGIIWARNTINKKIVGLSCLVYALGLFYLKIDEWIYLGLILFVTILAINGMFQFLGKSKLLLWLGSLSYEIYLIHQNIGYKIIHFLEKRNVLSFVAVLIATMVTLLLAVVLSKIIAYVLCRMDGSKICKKELK